MTTMKAEKRKYRGIEDLYEAEDNLRANTEATTVVQAKISSLTDSQKFTPVSNSHPNSPTEFTSLPESNSLSESNSQPNSSSQPNSNSLPNSNSHAESSRLLENPAAGYQNSSLSDSGSLPESTSHTLLFPTESNSISLMASLPETSGFTKFWHQLTDHLYRQLTPAEQVVHLQLYRLSWGYGNSICQIGLPKLAERAGVSRSTAQQAVNGLVKKGLIKKLRIIIGSDKQQGIEYRVEPPPCMVKNNSLPESNSLPRISRLPKSSPNKEHTIKETHTNTDEPSAVRVGSNFSLEECRRYADSLRQEGIINPGGYATKIYRSGEADNLITRFLAPKEMGQSVDINKCPDCLGTGFYYPDGTSAGVAKCRHERLINA